MQDTESQTAACQRREQEIIIFIYVILSHFNICWAGNQRAVERPFTDITMKHQMQFNTSVVPYFGDSQTNHEGKLSGV